MRAQAQHVVQILRPCIPPWCTGITSATADPIVAEQGADTTASPYGGMGMGKTADAEQSEDFAAREGEQVEGTGKKVTGYLCNHTHKSYTRARARTHTHTHTVSHARTHMCTLPPTPTHTHSHTRSPPPHDITTCVQCVTACVTHDCLQGHNQLLPVTLRPHYCFRWCFTFERDPGERTRTRTMANVPLVAFQAAAPSTRTIDFAVPHILARMTLASTQRTTGKKRTG